MTKRKITGLHLELTTKCNACCPMCNRNYKGVKRVGLQEVELSLKDCQTILSKDFLSELKLISLCGVFGDPIANTGLISIVDWIYSVNPDVCINIYTNGSTHDTKWWKNLAKSLKNGRVIFGIDGMVGVSEIHRRYTKFEKVIENAKAFIDAGGIAQWDYIVFKHNEHQVEEAKKFSKEIGFKDFQIKKTGRFFKTLYEYDQMLDSTVAAYGKHPVYDKQGSIEYYIELPEKEKYRNDMEEVMVNKYSQDKGLHRHFDDVKIECQALKTHGIFISAFGEIFPCCSIYQQVCYKTIFGVSDLLELNEYTLYQKYRLNALERSLDEILSEDFFEEIQKSFELPSIALGKCKCCARTCGKDINIQKYTHTGGV